MLKLIKDPMPLYRIARWCYQHHIPGAPSFITYFIRFFWSAFVPYSAEIGRGTQLGYGGLCVVIHKDAVIGHSCLVSQGVTIGGTGTKKGVPRIGNHVDIGAGAKLLGPISIGDGARIGANAVVLRDVPPNTTVVGAPARPISIREHAAGSFAIDE
jgi:serine O-acetyltransferase